MSHLTTALKRRLTIEDPQPPQYLDKGAMWWRRGEVSVEEHWFGSNKKLRRQLARLRAHMEKKMRQAMQAELTFWQTVIASPAATTSGLRAAKRRIMGLQKELGIGEGIRLYDETLYEHLYWVARARVALEQCRRGNESQYNNLYFSMRKGELRPSDLKSTERELTRIRHLTPYGWDQLAARWHLRVIRDPNTSEQQRMQRSWSIQRMLENGDVTIRSLKISPGEVEKYEFREGRRG